MTETAASAKGPDRRHGLGARLAALAASPRALPALAAVSFLESFVLFLPTDALIIPMVLAARDKAWRIAAVATLASVSGAVAGFGIGYFAYETIGQPLLAYYGHDDAFAVFSEYYNEWGQFVVLMGAISPFPYKVVNILSGATGLSLAVLVFYGLLGRGLRFFALAAIMRAFGPVVRDFVVQRMGLVFTGLTVLAIAIVVLLAWQL